MKQIGIIICVVIAALAHNSCRKSSSNSDLSDDSVAWTIFTVDENGVNLGDNSGRLAIKLGFKNGSTSSYGSDRNVTIKHKTRETGESSSSEGEPVVTKDRYLSREGAKLDGANENGQKNGRVNRGVVTKTKSYPNIEAAREDILNRRIEAQAEIAEYNEKIEIAVDAFNKIFDSARLDHNKRVRRITASTKDLLAAYEYLAKNHFKSDPYSELGREIRETSVYIDHVEGNLRSNDQQYMEKTQLINAARRALLIADHIASLGGVEGAIAAKEFATSFANLTVGFIPWVGWGHDVLKVLNGTNRITGESLTPTAYVFSVLGVFSGGILSKLRTPTVALGVLRKLAKTEIYKKAIDRAGKMVHFSYLYRKAWISWERVEKVTVDGAKFGFILGRHYTKGVIDAMSQSGQNPHSQAIPFTAIEATLQVGTKVNSQSLPNGIVRETWNLDDVYVHVIKNGDIEKVVDAKVVFNLR